MVDSAVKEQAGAHNCTKELQKNNCCPKKLDNSNTQGQILAVLSQSEYHFTSFSSIRTSVHTIQHHFTQFWGIFGCFLHFPLHPRGSWPASYFIQNGHIPCFLELFPVCPNACWFGANFGRFLAIFQFLPSTPLLNGPWTRLPDPQKVHLGGVRLGGSKNLSEIREMSEHDQAHSCT